jgi:hypothetical protein
MARCRQTDAVYAAAIDGRLTAAQQAHRAACHDCRAAINRAAAFDRELEEATGLLATTSLPGGILGIGAARRPRVATGLLAAVVATALVALGGVAVWVGSFPPADAGEPTASPPERMLHVVVSSSRRFAATMVVTSQQGSHASRVEVTLPACSGSYVAVPLGTTWTVQIGEIRYAVGPPSPVAGTAESDLTVRVTYGLGGADVLDGVPADFGLDPQAIVSSTVAPCR